MQIEKLFNVKNKVVLITGGSRGLGEMIASAFAINKAKVYISSRKEKDCNNTAKSISEKYYNNCFSLPQDISRIDGIENLLKMFSSKENHLDILINNAGAVWGEPLKDFSEQGWDKIMDLNVKSMFFMIQKFLPMLKKNAIRESPSKVINVGSIDGINTPTYENYSYSVSKAAVHKLTKTLASKLIKSNIVCNAIAPGPFPSKMLGSAVAHDYTIISKKNPSSRVGLPEDIGGATIYLGSKASNYVVGETIICDGGLIASAGHDLTNM